MEMETEIEGYYYYVHSNILSKMSTDAYSKDYFLIE